MEAKQISVGDKVRIVNPIIIDRVGYENNLTDVQKEVECRLQKLYYTRKETALNSCFKELSESVKDLLIYKESKDTFAKEMIKVVNNETGLEVINGFDFSSILDRIAREMAYQIVRYNIRNQNHERKVFSHIDEKLKDKEFEVGEIKHYITGKYCPPEGGGGPNRIRASIPFELIKNRKNREKNFDKFLQLRTVNEKIAEALILSPIQTDVIIKDYLLFILNKWSTFKSEEQDFIRVLEMWDRDELELDPDMEKVLKHSVYLKIVELNMRVKLKKDEAERVANKSW